MGKEVIRIQPLNNSYWECGEPFMIQRRYIQLYRGGVGVEHARCTFDTHQEWLDGVENIKAAASIINSCTSKTETLSWKERELYDTQNIQSTLYALSGWELHIKQLYPYWDIKSLHGWPGFKLPVRFGDKTIICDCAFLNFKRRELEVQGRNKETRSYEVFNNTLTFEELELIRKILRVGFLTNLEGVSRRLKFNHKASLSEYINSGFLA